MNLHSTQHIGCIALLDQLFTLDLNNAVFFLIKP
jgi:hypothetical protein